MEMFWLVIGGGAVQNEIQFDYEYTIVRASMEHDGSSADHET